MIREWVPFVGVGSCQLIDQVCLIAMWYSTLSVLIENNKSLLTGGKSEISGLSSKQKIFLDLRKTLAVLCSIFLALTLMIGSLYIVICTSPAAFVYYFEITSFLICLGSIHVIVSIRLIHLLRRSVDETKNTKTSVNDEDGSLISKQSAAAAAIVLEERNTTLAGTTH